MSWGRNGIGVGKVWEQGSLDVVGDIYESGIKLASKYLGILGKATDSAKFEGLSLDSFSLQTKSNLTYYVSTTGNDANNGLTSGTAFKTINKALSMIPSLVNHDVIINISAGTYPEYISFGGRIGKGSIAIIGATSGDTPLVVVSGTNTYDWSKSPAMWLSSGIFYISGYFMDLDVPTRILGLDFTPASKSANYSMGAKVMGVKHILFERCAFDTFEQQQAGSRGIEVAWGSTAYLWKCNFKSSPYFAILCGHNSEVTANGCTGISKTAYSASSMATILHTGSAISYTTAISEAGAAGWIYAL